jgi:N-acetylmuramic acid 6-phosphate etherase
MDIFYKNNKIKKRPWRIVMDDLKLDYEQAQRLLLLHGSVKKAVEARKEL